MLVRVQREHIHHFKEAVLDAEDNPTGEERDFLQFDLQFPEYPDLPTYGISLDFPIDNQKVVDAIRAKAQEVIAQMQRDENIKEQLAEVLEFNIGV